jgi:hypothetical protein
MSRKNRRKEINVPSALGIFDNSDTSGSDESDSDLQKTVTTKGNQNNYIAMVGSNKSKKVFPIIQKILPERRRDREGDNGQPKCMLDQKKSDRSSRYFDKARANAERGKIEKDVVREKMAAKVLMREGGKLDSDEQYLTSSYLDMLKKNQAWQAEDAQRENYNERNSVKNTVSLTKNL